MILKLTRVRFTPKGVFSKLTDPTGKTLFQTLTRAYPSSAIGAYPSGNYGEELWLPKVGPGEYLCVRGTHTLKTGEVFETFEIQGVLGHKNILFHPGNYQEDSEGCELLGNRALETMVLDSRAAFAQFMGMLHDQDAFYLEVS